MFILLIKCALVQYRVILITFFDVKSYSEAVFFVRLSNKSVTA